MRQKIIGSAQACLARSLTEAVSMRPATLKADADWSQDVDFLARLKGSWRSQYADYLGTHAADALVARLLACGDLLDHDPALTVVAEMDSRPVGIGSLRQAGDHCLITLLEVVESHRQLGVGRQLLEAMMSCGQPMIAHVSIHRPALLPFYERLGFEYFDRIAVDHYDHALEFDVMFRR